VLESTVDRGLDTHRPVNVPDGVGPGQQRGVKVHADSLDVGYCTVAVDL